MQSRQAKMLCTMRYMNNVVRLYCLQYIVEQYRCTKDKGTRTSDGYVCTGDKNTRTIVGYMCTGDKNTFTSGKCRYTRSPKQPYRCNQKVRSWAKLWPHLHRTSPIMTPKLTFWIYFPFILPVFFHFLADTFPPPWSMGRLGLWMMGITLSASTPWLLEGVSGWRGSSFPFLAWP